MRPSLFLFFLFYLLIYLFLYFLFFEIKYGKCCFDDFGQGRSSKRDRSVQTTVVYTVVSRKGGCVGF